VAEESLSTSPSATRAMTIESTAEPQETDEMRTPEFTATASLYKKGETYLLSKTLTTSAGPSEILPQLGFGFGGFGLAEPTDPDDYCDYCIQTIRLPCGLI
jgi:hypothetical protein